MEDRTMEIDIGTGFIIFFSSLALLCIIGYALVPDKKFLKILENKKASGAHSVNLIGTAIYGWKVLEKDQLTFYGIEPSDWHLERYKHYGEKLRGISFSERKHFPQIQTKFISLLFPFIPLRSQVIFNVEDRGLEKQFNALPIEMYLKQAFFILSVSYKSLILIAIILTIIF